MQTVTDARIYSVGECRPPRHCLRAGRALFEQAKVAPTTWRSSALAATPARHLDQAQGHGHRPVLGRRLPGRRGHRKKSSERPVWRRLQKLVIKDDKLVGACLYGDTVDGSWYFKLLRDGRSVSDIRDKLMFGSPISATPATRATTSRHHGRRRRSLRLQRRQQGQHLQGHQEPVHAGRGAQAHQGARPAAPARPGRADPDVHRRGTIPPRPSSAKPVH